MTLFDIWEPRWKDKVVLLAKHKVSDENQIVFTKTKSMPGTYWVSGEVVRSCPLDTNGRIACYAVPLDKLEKRD